MVKVTAFFRNQFTNLNKKSLPVKVKLAGDSGNKLPLKRSSNSLTHSITKPGVLRQWGRVYSNPGKVCPGLARIPGPF